MFKTGLESRTFDCCVLYLTINKVKYSVHKPWCSHDLRLPKNIRIHITIGKSLYPKLANIKIYRYHAPHRLSVQPATLIYPRKSYILHIIHHVRSLYQRAVCEA